MSRSGSAFVIRTFDGWGAVYLMDDKVFEGDADHCIQFVLEHTGVRMQKDDAFIADEQCAAPTLAMARARQARRDGPDAL